MLTKMQKWGNSFAVRLPKAAVQQSGFTEGEAVELEVSEDHIKLKRHLKPQYSLDELIAEITTANRHEESGFGLPKGREML